MDLKNAVAVCLISLFSATLVVLVARALDSQAASRLEPKLAEIVEELRALRKQGGGTAASSIGSTNDSVGGDGFIVYYLHSSTRCPTCLAIEKQAQETVQKDFAVEVGSGEICWKSENWEQPAGRVLADKFKVSMPMVVVAKAKAGQIQNWKSLDKVWALVDDKAKFTQYVRDEIKRFMGQDQQSTAPPPISIHPDPDNKAPDQAVPKPLPAIPIPE